MQATLTIRRYTDQSIADSLGAHSSLSADWFKTVYNGTHPSKETPLGLLNGLLAGPYRTISIAEESGPCLNCQWHIRATCPDGRADDLFIRIQEEPTYEEAITLGIDMDA